MGRFDALIGQMGSGNPLRSVTDYTNDFLTQDAKRQEIQQNALALQTTQRGLNESNALRQALASGVDPRTPEGQAKLTTIAPNASIPLIKGIADVSHVQAQTGNQEFDLRMKKADKAISDIAQLRSPEDATRSILEHYKSGDIDPNKARALLTSVPNDPADFPKWQRQIILGIMTAKDRAHSEMEQTKADTEAANQPLVKGPDGKWIINQPRLDYAQQATPPQVVSTDSGVVTVKPFANTAQYVTPSGAGPAFNPSSVSAGPPTGMRLGNPPPGAGLVAANEVLPDSQRPTARDYAAAPNTPQAQAALADVRRSVASQPTASMVPIPPVPIGPNSQATIRNPTVPEDRIGARRLPVEQIQIVDPLDKSKLIWVDKNRLPTGDRSQYYLGDAGKTPEAVTKQQQAQGGVDSAIQILSDMRQAYQVLQNTKGITDPNQSTVENVLASVRSSTPGQWTGSVVGTPEQSARRTIENNKSLLLGTIKKAIGMGQKELDSNADMKRWMNAVTSPSTDIASNIKALDGIEEFIRRNAATKENLRTAAGEPTSAPTRPPLEAFQN